MTQPYVLEGVGEVLGQGLGTLCVAQMAVSVLDAVLQIAGVRSGLKHLRVVVGLDYQIVGAADYAFHLIGYGTHIC